MSAATECRSGGMKAEGRPGAVELRTDLCRFRVDESVFIRQLKALAVHFAGSSGPVVDLGCGRGTMLQILKSSGINCYGVDAFVPALEECRVRGLDVVESDVFQHLSALLDNSIGGIFCSHLIEHLASAEALTLLRESHRVIRPGGALVIITPNPKDLNVLTEVFWLDLTHVRFYPAALLGPLLREAGFRFAECYEDTHTRYSRIFHRRIGGFLRRLWLWGFTNRGDVVAVGRK
jgi:2-polyprenyl-3-methyl-5-hydroxy-6-metoxy-1,4-benzoquinol methylase